MNLQHYIAQKILSSSGDKQSISKPIVKIAIGGIALGVAVMIATLAIVTGFQNEIRNKITGFASHISVASYDNNVSYEPEPINRNQEFIKELKANPEIKHIQVFATKSGIIKTKNDNEGVILKGVGKDYNWSFIQSNLMEGKTFNVTDTGINKSIVISTSLANRLDIKLGQKMLIYFITKRKATDTTSSIGYEQRVRDFYVTGIYQTGFNEQDSKAVFIDIAQIQKLNYWNKNQVGGFEIEIQNFNKINEMGEYVYDVSGQGLTSQTVKESNPSLFSWLDLMNQNAIIIIVLMILVSAINMISALLIMILERTNMIGILKALGCCDADVRKIFIHQALYLIGKGLFWGNLIGISLCLIQQYFKLISLDQESYYISFIPINLNIIHILVLNAGTFVICMLMMIIPTLIISKITPIKAIRFN